jgi:hypothetical protein
MKKTMLAGIPAFTPASLSYFFISPRYLLARQSRLGATMGVAGSFKESGDMVGPLLIDLLSQAFGLTAGFVSCGVLGLLSFLLITG